MQRVQVDSNPPSIWMLPDFQFHSPLKHYLVVHTGTHTNSSNDGAAGDGHDDVFAWRDRRGRDTNTNEGQRIGKRERSLEPCGSEVVHVARISTHSMLRSRADYCTSEALVANQHDCRVKSRPSGTGHSLEGDNHRKEKKLP